MNRNTSGPDRTDDEPRRGFLKSGAAALGAAVLGFSASGTAQRQTGQTDPGPEEGDPDFVVNDEQYECMMLQEHYQPVGEFIITSPVIDWTPEVPVEGTNPLEGGFNTRMIRYRDGRTAQIFVDQSAEISGYDRSAGYVVDDEETFGKNEFVQPEVYALSDQGFSFHEETDRLVPGVFTPVEEDYESDVLQIRSFGLQRDRSL